MNFLPPDPFHAGERAMQEQTGMRRRMSEIGPRVIRNFMPDQHRDFFAQLPFLVIGYLDASGQPWASMLHGSPGFAHSPQPQQLRIDALPPPGSGVRSVLAPGVPMGLLGLQPQTRRRNRMNGHVSAVDAGGFEVQVDQSFGNCPQYIRVREAFPGGDADSQPVAEHLSVLDAEAQSLIARADTLFIASSHLDAVDVSHRGGAAGFVGTDEQGRLLLPDYAGNFFFNTLGNLLLEPRAGLLFIDFETGDLLQVAATAEILLEGPEVAKHPGAERLLRLTVSRAIRLRAGSVPHRSRT